MTATHRLRSASDDSTKVGSHRSTMRRLAALGTFWSLMAAVPAHAQTTPSTTVKARLDGAITVARVLANGSLRFAPPPVGVRPKTTRTKAQGVADKAVSARAAGRASEIFFALFSAPSPARPSADGSLVAVFSRRPVWVVRYAGVRGQRQSGVIVRQSAITNKPTTTLSLSVRTDIVVVIDDATASEVLRSEYAS